jgi:hypothetical protein
VRVDKSASVQGTFVSKRTYIIIAVPGPPSEHLTKACTIEVIKCYSIMQRPRHAYHIVGAMSHGKLIY